MTRREEQGRYQMLWDCPACGATGLLGLDHRFCPSCGSAQDPSLRYFPPDEAKVAVEDHPYHGADKVCPACDTPNSAASEFCQACGSPLDEAKAAALRADRVTAEGEEFQGETAADARAEARERRQQEQAERLRQMSGQPAPERDPPTPPKRKKPGLLGFGCLGAIAVVVLGIAVVCALNFFWSKTDQVQVVEQSWQREIQVESFGAVQRTAWRDELPIGARDLRCKPEKRGSNKVQDGEDCATRRQDKGDGTFAEIQECKPRFRDEPFYADRCRFTVDDWKVARTEQAAGADATPRWPTVTLGSGEREGKRDATYRVRVKASDGQEHTCALQERQWASLTPGTRLQASFGGITGAIDCSSLRP